MPWIHVANSSRHTPRQSEIWISNQTKPIIVPKALEPSGRFCCSCALLLCYESTIVGRGRCRVKFLKLLFDLEFPHSKHESVQSLQHGLRHSNASYRPGVSGHCDTCLCCIDLRGVCLVEKSIYWGLLRT